MQLRGPRFYFVSLLAAYLL